MDISKGLERQTVNERAKTARLRFFMIKNVKQAMPFIVCDGDSVPKSIATFRNEPDAEAFLATRRTIYVELGT